MPSAPPPEVPRNESAECAAGVARVRVAVGVSESTMVAFGVLV